MWLPSSLLVVVSLEGLCDLGGSGYHVGGMERKVCKETYGSCSLNFA